VSGLITLTVNNNTIFEFPNTSGFDSGNIMVGFNDQFDSVGSQSTYAVIDNVRVVNLSTGTTISITDVEISGNQVQIDFTATGGGQPGEFVLESTPSLNPVAWGTENGATIVAMGGGFRATVASSGPARFYRIAK
jgi:hypothetical protein